MAKSIIIIGAGIAGLAAGCYARMNGYETEIFELHDKPGGLCTAWERKGYTIDGCLHWLTGSAKGASLYRFWEELGMVQGKKIFNPERFFQIESPEGKVFSIFTDVGTLERHLKELAPEDAAFIKEFTSSIRRLTRFNLPAGKAPELYSLVDGIKLLIRMLPYWKDLRKWSKMSMTEFAMRFKNPFLRNAWKSIWIPELSSLFILITLAEMHMKTAGYVIGGSMELSRGIEKRYLGLGGKISYKSEVKKILVENNKAIGIKLADGTEHRADTVISAADGYATIFEMLDGRYINDKTRSYYKNLPIFQPLIYVGLGVNRSFEDLPKVISGFVMPLEKPVTIAGKEQKSLSVRIHNFDSALAPAGKTVITAMVETNYAYWEELRNDLPQYRAEKERIADIFVDLLDKRFPGLASQVEMRDVATPVTFKRYTGNWQGSYEGWLLTPETFSMNMSKTLPGLDRFYMAGQWVQPGGGIPSGVMTGSYVIQMLCKRDKKKFVTAVP